MNTTGPEIRKAAILLLKAWDDGHLALAWPAGMNLAYLTAFDAALEVLRRAVAGTVPGDPPNPT